MNNAESAVLIKHQDQVNDEFSLLDLVAFIKNNWLGILGAALTGAGVGLALAFTLPAQWEATALVRAGQLGKVKNVVVTLNAGATANVGDAVEPSLQLVDRLKSKSFQNDVMARMSAANGDFDEKAEAFSGSLKVKLEKSELIRLVLRGSSAGEVNLQMNAIISELKEVHRKMSAPTILHLLQELKSIDQELKRVSVELDRMTKFLNGLSTLNEKNFSQAVLASNILIAREAESRAFRERKNSLEEQLSPERTFSTDVFGRIEVSSEPVAPKKSLFTLAGFFIGLLLGVLFAHLKSAGFLASATKKTGLK